MDPGYETVVELQDLLWTLAAYLLHGTIVFLHAGLACFLLGAIRITLGPTPRAPTGDFA